jgi:hypothetical protein
MLKIVRSKETNQISMVTKFKRNKWGLILGMQGVKPALISGIKAGVS